MSTATATEVIDHLQTVIVAISPTVDGGAKQFQPMPDNRAELQGRPTVRLFQLVFAEGSDGAPTDGSSTAVQQLFRLTLVYALQGQSPHGLNALRRKIRSDVRDIRAAVNLGTNWLQGSTELQRVTAWGVPYPDAAAPLTTMLLQDVTILVSFFESSTPAP